VVGGNSPATFPDEGVIGGGLRFSVLVAGLVGNSDGGGIATC
jgi:hypothetical protein